jgi:hypothetical protein
MYPFVPDIAVAGAIIAISAIIANKAIAQINFAVFAGERNSTNTMAFLTTTAV